MPEFEVRKKILTVEEVYHEGGPAADQPLLRGTAMAVINNPYAGRYEADISAAMDALKPLGLALAGELIAALGGADNIQSYGKGAIAGSNGELEHAALWHVPGGWAMREQLGDSMAIVPSTKKVGAPGVRLDVPLTHVNASYVRSHFDAVEAGVNDAPRADELLVILAMATGGRIHARVGGLAADAIEGKDGLR
jgi:hypothetical protein